MRAQKWQAQQKIRSYYNRYALSAESRNKKQEEQRLQDTLGSKYLRLRFDWLIGEWQVWEDSPFSGLYCITNLGSHLEVTKAIWILRQRQLNKREMLALLESNAEYNNRRMEAKINAIASQMADGVRSHTVGKVTCSLRE